MCLEKGKHVIIEKPICLNSKDAEEIYRVAKEKNLFVLENMWTRFFPITRKAKELIKSGEIGEVKIVESDFGKIVPYNKDL